MALGITQLVISGGLGIPRWPSMGDEFLAAPGIGLRGAREAMLQRGG